MAKDYDHHEAIIFPAMACIILHRSTIAKVIRNMENPIL